MDMNRRSFLKSMMGVAGAAALGDLRAITGPIKGPSGCHGPIGPPGLPSIYHESGQSVQKAIDSLGQKGGIVFLRAGTYIANEIITIPENVGIIGQGNLTIANCSIRAAAPITLLGEHNVIKECYLSAMGKLDHFFEVPWEHGNVVVGNIFERAKNAVLKPFQDLALLIREGSCKSA